MAKWVIRLSTYDITYDTGTAIKSQALADFVVNFSPSQMTTAEEEFQRVISRMDTKPWTLYTDGASNLNGTGLGLVLKSPQGDMIAHSICCDFKATNNEAEYEALIMGLTTAKDMKVRNIDANGDSLLIVNHVNGSYEAKDPKMITYLDITKKLMNYFKTFNIQQVPRENNVQADALAGLGLFLKPTVERLVHDIEVLALNQHDDNTNEDMDNWIQAYKDYLQLGVKPNSNNEAKILQMKGSRFTVTYDELFKKSSTGILQRCLRKNKAGMVLRMHMKGSVEITPMEETSH
ncbi:uncharacterized protein LOC141693796 [Apium graveolens]|uniref:uncharacterized protein LOC141693796 n=1 Tax=Apium graveolens TaxID=4045 RepID=UPI003D78E8C0